MALTNYSSNFTSAEDFFAWCRSEEGGRLVVRTTPNTPYALIYYDKDTTNMEMPHVGQFRSVIWNTDTNAPVCSGPVRGLPFSRATEDGVDLSSAVVEEFADGVMINMFHNGTWWVLSTRTRLFATCSFYGHRTFTELFWEAIHPDAVAALNPAHTYSWVLQHPEERIVIAPNYGIPRVFLVETSCPETELPEVLRKLRPTRYNDLATLADVQERVTAWGKRFNNMWQGLVIKTTDGRRYKLRSKQYDAARLLRGNQPKLSYVWLERWDQGLLGQYLAQYPEERTAATALVERFKECVQELHNLYQRVYRKKELRLGEAPQKYRKLLWDCHAANAGAYFPNTRKFMNAQDTARKLWLVNYEQRYGGSTN